MLEQAIAKQQHKTTSARAIWTLATSRENGIATSIHNSERDAYERLADLWFPNFGQDSTHQADSANHTAMLAALSQSLEAAKRWFEDYQLSEDTTGDAIIELHEIPVAPKALPLCRRPE